MRKQRFTIAAAICLIVLTVPAMAVEPGPQGVSPGAPDRIARVGGACPTFSWEATPGAARYELVVHRWDDEARASSSGELSPETEVLFTAVSGRATSWTPEASDCFSSGGAHVWFVRAVTDANDGGEWSEPRFFEVDTSPSPEQVRQAIDVLGRYLEAGGDIELDTLATRVWSPAATAGSRGGASATKGEAPESRSVITGTTAIRGEQPDPSGETYGVVGVSASPDGAGIGAANTAGGPDLVLDGVVPVELSETGVDRPSAAAQSFSFVNSGGGGLTLDVDGVDVVTTATDQNTTYTAGSGLFLQGTIFAPNWNITQKRVSQSCAAGMYIREITNTGNVYCYPDLDQNTTYTSGYGLSLSGTAFSVNTAIIQTRVDSICPTGQYMTGVNAGGNVYCEFDQDEDTTYTAGSGLVLSHANVFSLAPGLQTRVDGTCAVGSSIREINPDGTVYCHVDQDEDTTYAAGLGLNLLSGNVFSANLGVVQRRVDGSCAAGSSIRVIYSDGTVTCEVDDTGTLSSGDGAPEVGARPSVRAHGLGQSLSAGSNVAAFPIDDWDPHGMRSGDGLAMNFAPHAPGLYLMTATLAFDDGLDLRREVRLIHEDAAESESTIIASKTGSAGTVSLSTVYSFRGDGDHVMIEILVDGAENMSAMVPSNFTMTWIAPPPTS